MKNMGKVLALLLTLVMVFSLTMTSAVFAGAGNDKGNGKAATTDSEKVKGNDKKDDTTVEDKTENQDDADSEAVEGSEHEKAVKEKDKVMEQKKELKNQLFEAKKAGNTEMVQQLTTQLNQFKEQLKEMVRNSYTEQEMTQLQLEAGIIAAEDPTLEIAPVDKVIAKGKTLKFDIPPVIKDGNVLVPVRAFSQAYGAEVNWNPEDHTVTIVKDGIEIVLKTDSSIVYVNGVETDLGLPVKAINSRNVMPVGFLAEKLGLKVEVDEEDGTVEIEEDVDDAEDTEEVETEEEVTTQEEVTTGAQETTEGTAAGN